MPRLCSICQHPDRKAIDKALLNGDALRDIVSKCSVSRPALDRHKNGGHIARAVERSQQAREDARAIDLVRELTECLDYIRRLQRAPRPMAA